MKVNINDFVKARTYAQIITALFFLMLLIIFTSASMPYVAKKGVELALFTFFAPFVFSALLMAMWLYKGTQTKPAGFAYLVAQWKLKNYRLLIKLIFTLPIFSALLAYFFTVFFEVSPAYPTKLASSTLASSEAICTRSGRDKIRGSWSVFQLASGETWKVAGFDQLCNRSQKMCSLNYSIGYFGYYITGVECG